MGLKDLDGGVWKTRVAEPKPSKGYLRRHSDETARDAVYANRRKVEIRHRTGGHAQTRRDGRAQLRPRSRPRRDAARVVAWEPERSQALTDPCRGLQSRHSDARVVRVRHFKSGRERQKRAFVRLSDAVAMAIVIVVQINGKMALLAVVAAPEAE